MPYAQMKMRDTKGVSCGFEKCGDTSRRLFFFSIDGGVQTHGFRKRESPIKWSKKSYCGFDCFNRAFAEGRSFGHESKA